MRSPSFPHELRVLLMLDRFGQISIGTQLLIGKARHRCELLLPLKQRKQHAPAQQMHAFWVQRSRRVRQVLGTKDRRDGFSCTWQHCGCRFVCLVLLDGAANC